MKIALSSARNVLSCLLTKFAEGENGCTIKSHNDVTKQLLRVMKLTGFLIFVVSLHVTANGIGQNISLSFKNAPLKKVFSEIIRQSGTTIVYNDAMLKHARPVSIEVKNATIERVLNLSLKDQPLIYTIEDGLIIVKPNPNPNLNQEPGEVPGFQISPPPIAIRGRILNEKGEPVVASIVIKNTKRGTTSDAEGFFTLDNVDDNAELIISATNIETVTVPVNNKTSLSISVKMTSSSLNEVVVNKGYYTEKKKFSTGSVSTVRAKDIERQPVTSPLMLLQGRMPGVDITPSSGIPGAAPRVVIRGRNSILNNNATPLYIIDGVPVNSNFIPTDNSTAVPEGFDPMSTINPANIESFEVLKDADATAIYGSRGANGVILITTKNGNRSEKTNIDLSFYSGVGRIPRFLDLLSTPEYVAIRTEALINGNAPINATRAPDLVVWDTTRYTDWQKELIGGAASITDIQANVSSGNAFTSFRFGAGYHKEGTIYPGDFGFKRMTGHFNLNHRSRNQKFSANLNMNYGAEFNKLFSGFSLTDAATTLAPNAPALYDAAGNLNWESSTFSNPLARFNMTDNNEGNNLVFNSILGYEFVKGLNLKLSIGYNTLNRNEIIKKSPFSAMDPAKITDETTATSIFSTNNRQGWIIEPQASYQHKYGELDFSAVAGATWQANSSRYQLVEASGYTSDVLLESIKGATQTTYYNDDDLRYRYMAMFGRLGLNYKERYILNLTGRRDGSSRFGPDRRWGNFGAVGAAWIFSEENLMQRFPFLSFGKLRGSYGVTGSDQVMDYKYLSVYQYGAYTYQGRITLIPTGLSNNKIAWEQTVKLEAALELGFLQDRIRLEAAFYRNRCANQLLDYQLPGTAGYLGVTENLDAIVENKGFEILIQTVNLNGTHFQWQTSLNFTLPNNKLVSYPDLDQSPDATRFEVGQSLNIAKLFNYIGVNPSTGLYEVRDIDGNGIFDYKDQTFIQNTDRRYYGGINNTLRYKNIELSFLLQFSGQTSFNTVFYAPGSLPYNTLDEVVGNYWRKNGDIARYQKATVTYSELAGQSYTNSSNAAYVNSSFIRLKTLSLSYNLPEVLLNKAGLKACRFYIQGQNLLTFSNFRALDPEAKINSLPPIQIITAGLEIKL